MDLFLGPKRIKKEGIQLAQLQTISQFIDEIEFNRLINITEEDFVKNCYIAFFNEL